MRLRESDIAIQMGLASACVLHREQSAVVLGNLALFFAICHIKLSCSTFWTLTYPAIHLNMVADVPYKHVSTVNPPSLAITADKGSSVN